LRWEQNRQVKQCVRWNVWCAAAGVFLSGMALADPFKAGLFVCCVAQRDFCAAPRCWFSLLIGVFLRLSHACQVNDGPDSPAAGGGGGSFFQRSHKLRAYLPGLILAAGVVILLWMPILIRVVGAGYGSVCADQSRNLQNCMKAAPVASLWGQLPS